MTTWISAGASVIGSSHIITKTPCQDASVIKTSVDGQWVVMVISDGAGTAARAEEGARKVAEFFSKELFALIDALQIRPPGHWINDFVIEKVLQTRIALRELALSDDIRDFHCTLVACLAGPSGGFSIHIGDGLVVGGYRSSKDSGKPFQLYFSEPENGEYANETYFITEGDWIKHLRISPMPRMDWIFCCSDGGGALALTNDTELKVGFLEPVIQNVFALSDEESRNKKIAEYLSDPQSEKVTNDDKSIIVSIKSGSNPNLSDYLPRSTSIDIAPILPIDPSTNLTKTNPSFGPKTAKKKSKIKKYLKLVFAFAVAIALIILVVLVVKFLPSVAELRQFEPAPSSDRPSGEPRSRDQEEPTDNAKPAIENAPRPSNLNPPALKNYKT